MTGKHFPRSYIYPVPKCIEDEVEQADAALVADAASINDALGVAIEALPPRGRRS